MPGLSGGTTIPVAVAAVISAPAGQPAIAPVVSSAKAMA
jgi:hypothetical protein